MTTRRAGSMLLTLCVVVLMVGACGESAAKDNARRLVAAGWIEGSISDQAGHPVPDGTFVSVGFDSGPTQVGRTVGGRYALPLLGIQEGDAVSWIPFQLRAGGEGIAVVQPDSPLVSRDIHLTQATQPGSDPHACPVVVGSVSGRAPRGATAVSVRVAGGIEERVSVKEGWYSVPSVGVLCSDGTLRMAEMRFDGVGEPFMPQALHSRLDLP